MRRLVLGCVVGVTIALVGSGCSKDGDGDKGKSGKAKRDPAPTKASPTKASPTKTNPTKTNPSGTTKVAAGTISIRSADGKTALVLEPTKKGFRIKDATGKKIGRVKIEGDKIKVRDGAGSVSKAKRKGDGFKLYADDKALLKIKKRGKNKYKLKTPDNVALGTVKGRTATLVKGDKVVVEVVGGITTVMRAGKALFNVTGLKPTHAVFLGLTEFTLHQRLAAALAAARW